MPSSLQKKNMMTLPNNHPSSLLSTHVCPIASETPIVHALAITHLLQTLYDIVNYVHIPFTVIIPSI